MILKMQPNNGFVPIPLIEKFIVQISISNSIYLLYNSFNSE